MDANCCLFQKKILPQYLKTVKMFIFRTHFHILYDSSVSLPHRMNNTNIYYLNRVRKEYQDSLIFKNHLINSINNWLVIALFNSFFAGWRYAAFHGSVSGSRLLWSRSGSRSRLDVASTRSTANATADGAVW